MIEHNPIPILVIRYRKLKAQVDALKSQMDVIKAELEPLVEAQDGKWTDSTGYARIIQRKVSVFYNVKALEVLRESVPEIAQVIGPHRKERPGSRYLQIK